MSTRLGFGIAACMLMALLFAKPGEHAQGAKTCTLNAQDMIDSYMDKDGHWVYNTILVTLYRKGEPIRSTELTNMGGVSDSRAMVRWTDLDPGVYEAHFEAHKHGVVVKKLVLSADAPSTLRIDALVDKDETYGAGPTLFELEKRIAALEKAKG